MATDLPRIVQIFAERLHYILGDDLLAVYIGGSFSTGDFVRGASDDDRLRPPPPNSYTRAGWTGAAMAVGSLVGIVVLCAPRLGSSAPWVDLFAFAVLILAMPATDGMGFYYLPLFVPLLGRPLLAAIVLMARGAAGAS